MSDIMMISTWVAVAILALAVELRTTGAIIIRTEGQQLINNGQSPFLSNLQSYDPVSAEQQMGSPNFQQPNILTGQKIEIQSATSKPVFSAYGQQQSATTEPLFNVYGQQVQCTPHPSGPQSQFPSLPVDHMITEELYHLYNLIHSNTRPFTIHHQQQQLQQQHPYQQQQPYQQPQQQQQQQQQQQYGYGQYQGQGPANPIQQLTGTSQPLQVFQGSDHVPLSMQMSSQYKDPVFVNNNQQSLQQQQQTSAPLLGGIFSNNGGQQQPVQSGSYSQSGTYSYGQPTNQQQQVIQSQYNPTPTPRPAYNYLGSSSSGSQRPDGFQPLNIGKRSVRNKRQAQFSVNFNPDLVNDPSSNALSLTSSNNNQGNSGLSRLQQVPDYFTDPYKYQMDQMSSQPGYQRGQSAGSGNRDQGIKMFSNPSFFIGSTNFDDLTQSGASSAKSPSDSTSSANQPQTNSAPSVTSGDSSNTVSSDSGHPISSVSSDNLSQGGSSGSSPAVAQGGSKDLSATNQGKMTSNFDPDSANQVKVTQDELGAGGSGPSSRYDPNEVNNMSFNFFNPSRMITSGQRGKRRAPLRKRRQAMFDPSKMSAAPFKPDSMNSGSYDPSIVNTAKHQNPASHPTGSFDPSSMLAGSYNPGSGDAGNSNPASSMSSSTNQNGASGNVAVPATQYPTGPAVTAAPVNSVSNGLTQSGAGTQAGITSAPSQGQGQAQGSNLGNFDPNSMPAGSYNPSSSGLFDPSAWAAFLG